MREMIFNHASANPAVSMHEATEALADLAKGMAQLVKQGATEKSLRSALALSEIIIAAQSSLYDVLVSMVRGPMREEARFLLSLAQKYPLLAELTHQEIERFYGSEADPKLGAARETLLLCLQQNGIAISLPAISCWDSDELEVRYHELNAAGESIEAYGVVDNLARATHANKILQRSAHALLKSVTFKNFWQQRAAIFPNLQFGLEVEEHLKGIGNHLFPTIFHCLQGLQQSASEWHQKGGALPRWRSKVTDESLTVQQNPKLAKHRDFKDANGQTQAYFWHARFGDHRIHFRLIEATKILEIAYIGPHLPL